MLLFALAEHRSVYLHSPLHLVHYACLQHGIAWVLNYNIWVKSASDPSPVERFVEAMLTASFADQAALHLPSRPARNMRRTGNAWVVICLLIQPRLKLLFSLLLGCKSSLGMLSGQQWMRRLAVVVVTWKKRRDETSLGPKPRLPITESPMHIIRKHLGNMSYPPRLLCTMLTGMSVTSDQEM